MKIVAVIPIKTNNSRLPQKNTRVFTSGKPLCSYVMSTVAGIDVIDKTYVFCSDDKIREYVSNGICFLKRDSSLDEDSTSMNQVLRAFSERVVADIYVLVHVTSPFISTNSIEKGINAVKSGEYDSALSVLKVQDFFWNQSGCRNYDPQNVPRTQDLPAMYKETSGFYIFERKIITDFGKRIGEKPFFVEVTGKEAIDIDEEEDFLIADAIDYYTNKVLM